MCKGTHWGLVVCDTSSATAVVYDSYAHQYDYSATIFESREPKLRRVWSQITDSPLQHLRIAGKDLVHEQDDYFSCGVFICIYAERLSRGEQTKAEEATSFFLQNARRKISRCLRACFAVSGTVNAGSAPLPRIYDSHLLPTSYTLFFTEQRAEAIAEEIRETLTTENTSLHNEVSQIAHQPKIFTLEETVFVQRSIFCELSNVHVMKTCLEEPLPSGAYTKSIRTSSFILVVFYRNLLFGSISAAVFQHFPRRPRATVFDFVCTHIEAPIRAHLLKIGKLFGFVGATLRSSKDDCFHKTDAAVTVSFCVSKYVKGVEVSGTDITSANLEEHRKHMLTLLDSIPSSYASRDLETLAAQMYLTQCIAKTPGVAFINTLLEDSISDSCAIAGRQFSKPMQLAILYINTLGILCGAVVKKYYGEHVCIVFDFSSMSASTMTDTPLQSLTTIYGYDNCDFVVPFHGTFLYQSEIPAAVSYYIMCILKKFTKSPTFSLDAIRSHAAYIHGLVSTQLTDAPDNKLVLSTTFPTALHLGPMNVKCPYCSAVSFRGEPKLLCCNGGVNIVPEHVLPQRRDGILDWLFLEVRSNEKLYYMFRALNNLVAFAGLSIKMRQFNVGIGQLPLVVQGTVDVGICHLNPDSDIASYAQLYICDDYKCKRSIDETLSEYKMKIEHKLVERILTTLRENNVIAMAYQSMYEVYLAEAEALRIRDNDILPKILMNLKHKREIPDVSSNTHKGCLNIPQINNEVAAIYVCRNGVFPSEEELDKGLRVYSRGGRSIAAHHNNNIDAMSYPLYFPKGQQSFVRERLPKTRKRPATDQTIVSKARKRPALGESIDIDDPDPVGARLLSDDEDEDDQVDSQPSKFLSRSDFYRFILARRGNLLEHRFYGSGKLLSQFVIHVYARIEADLLSAIERHTTEIRSTKATSLYTFLDQQLQEKGFKLGKLINLPRYFVGSNGWFDQLYHNAMAVAQRVGKPDLFITFTGNHEWPEIRENLVTEFDSWITDPLLCARVFR
ncbi:unnamed protein product, partial [Cylicostephanus goldi]